MEDVQALVVQALDSQARYNESVTRFVEVVEQRFAEEERLIAEIRDELHEALTALSNRIEALHRG